MWILLPVKQTTVILNDDSYLTSAFAIFFLAHHKFLMVNFYAASKPFYNFSVWVNKGKILLFSVP